MVNVALSRMSLPSLKNRIVDTALLYLHTRIDIPLMDKQKIFTLDEIAGQLLISKKDRHAAAGDPYIMTIAF